MEREKREWNEWIDRETIAWNSSCVNKLKGTVLHRTVQRHRINGKSIPTYAERSHTEPFQSSLVNTALMCFVKKVCRQLCIDKVSTVSKFARST